MRLNHHLRQRIRDGLLKRQFAITLDNLSRRRQSLVVEAHEAHYQLERLDLLRDAPAGYFETRRTFSIATLLDDAERGKDLVLGLRGMDGAAPAHWHLANAEHALPVPHRDARGPAPRLVVDPTSEVGEDALELSADIRAYNDRIAAAAGKLDRFLGKCRRVEDVTEVIPEASPFAVVAAQPERDTPTVDADALRAALALG